MELKKLTIAVLMLCVLNVKAQDDAVYARNGLLKATATIAPSVMLNRKASNIYLSGFAEYFFEDIFSVRGDLVTYVDGIAPSNNYYKYNTACYFGLYYHPNKRKNLDPYIGLQPGLAVGRVNSFYNEGYASKVQATPSVALHGGLTFYFWKFFNFYADVAYVHVDMQDMRNGSSLSDELIFSVGLGFHFNVLKDKKK
jgi:hypothetical protein